MTVKYRRGGFSVGEDFNNTRSAPEQLRLVQEFVNTRSNLRDLDLLEGTAGTGQWLTEHDLLPPDRKVTEGERLSLVAFRESIRGILAAHNDPSYGETATGGLDKLAGASLLRVSFTPSGEPWLIPTGEGAERAIASLLSVIVRSSLEGTWRRLKACRNEECRWAFYDSSKNCSGAWCDMQTCGARHKMQAYRKRKLR